MAKFQSVNKQALEAIKKIQNEGKVASVGSNRNYLQAFKNVAKNTTGNLRDLTEKQALEYLNERAKEVAQKTLDLDRQAIQHLLNKKLPVIKSSIEKKFSQRKYTPEQVQAIANRQNERNSLATLIAYKAGLRAHELITLQKASNQPADERPSHDSKFSHRDGEIYTVKGKGGLTREVLIPTELAHKLELNKLDTPKNIVDRGVNYQQHYNISAGKNFSKSLSRVSKSTLGWSRGAHGLRYSYAQERMKELHSHPDALRIVSQELGHFRPDITLLYLR